MSWEEADANTVCPRRWDDIPHGLLSLYQTIRGTALASHSKPRSRGGHEEVLGNLARSFGSEQDQLLPSLPAPENLLTLTKPCF